MDTYVIGVKNGAALSEMKIKARVVSVVEGVLRAVDEQNQVVGGVPISELVYWYREGSADVQGGVIRSATESA